MTIPLSLYIHLPWCLIKCPYCDFNSHPLRGDLPEQSYLQALRGDLQESMLFVEKRPLVSIFFGGGTPSLFSPQAIQNILSEVSKYFSFSPNIEITLEANPGTFEIEKFKGFRQAGVNRLSIGIQSFQLDKLKSLGRVHDAKEALKAAEIARTAGFENFNLDLMHGLPNQTVEDALLDLKTALSFSPPHLSWYQLTLEPNTAFAHQPPTLPNEAILETIQDEGEAYLENNHFSHYEISAFSIPEKQSQHNRNYWLFGDYLGIGAGAHSKLTHQGSAIQRLTKIKHPREYLNAKQTFITENKMVPTEELPFEFMLNALRLYEPISITLFEERTGLKFDRLKPALQKAEQKKLITLEKNSIEATELGKKFYNDTVQLFLD